jgi:F0F1-type ATP synthase delta subunit
MTEDPSIIGGMTVKVGSKFIDASVKTRLDRLEKNLKKTNVAA